MEDCLGDMEGSGQGARGGTGRSTEERRCRWRVLGEPEIASWGGLQRRGHYNVGSWGMCQNGESPDLKEGARGP